MPATARAPSNTMRCSRANRNAGRRSGFESKRRFCINFTCGLRGVEPMKQLRIARLGHRERETRWRVGDAGLRLLSCDFRSMNFRPRDALRSFGNRVLSVLVHGITGSDAMGPPKPAPDSGAVVHGANSFTKSPLRTTRRAWRPRRSEPERFSGVLEQRALKASQALSRRTASARARPRVARPRRHARRPRARRSPTRRARRARRW